MTLADANAAANMPDVAVIRDMSLDDAELAATLHRDVLDHGFFARLGVPFLTAYYRSFAASPHAIALVADSPSEPVGMLVGTAGPSHYRWAVRHHGWRLAVHGAAALLTRPRELVFFVRTRVLWYLRTALRMVAPNIGQRGRDRSTREPKTAVLTHVAVSPGARGTGAGSALVDAFLSTARRRGCANAMLVTLAGRAGAGRFYRRLGWTLRDLRRDRDGRLHECYERRL